MMISIIDSSEHKQQLRQNMIRLNLKILAKIVSVSKPYNPYTHLPLPERAYLESPQIYHKITKTKQAYEKWRKLDLEERIKRVQSFTESVINDEKTMRQSISNFTGKSYKHISYQYSKLGNQYLTLINHSRQMLKPVQFETISKGKKLRNTVVNEPIGLALIFPYFSEPIFDTMIHLVPCLLSGNGALLKVSDFNHFLGPYLQQKSNEIIGLEGLVSDLFFHPKQLKEIREFRPIKKVIYSGSQTSASKIFELLVENRFIDCNLFYGGQDCAYIDETADLQKAAKDICNNTFYNNGQSYDCIKRLYLNDTIADKFYELIGEEACKLKIGNPQSKDTDLGPLTVPENGLKFEEMLNDAINGDASCLTGGMLTNDAIQKGIFCQPTIMINCNTNMQVVQEQLHAPVLCIQKVSSFQQFQNLSSQNVYGTGIRIFTKNPQQYSQYCKRVQVGYISFNDGSITNADLPIEGWKRSGKGKMLSQLSYEQYAVQKSIVEQL